MNLVKLGALSFYSLPLKQIKVDFEKSKPTEEGKISIYTSSSKN